MRTITRTVSRQPTAKAPQGDDPGVTLTVSHSFAELEKIRDEWDRLLLELNGDIYQSFEWCRIWWRHYGNKRRLCVFVFRDDRGLVGIVPVFCERIRIGPTTLSVAKLVGADSALTIAAPMVKRQCATQAYREVVRALNESDRPDVISLGPMADEDAAAGGLSVACDAAPDYELVSRPEPDDVQTVFELPGSFKQYIDSLDKRQRQNYRRDSNLINREFTITADVVSHPQCAGAEFDAFIAMHQEQWAAQGRAGHFGDWPGSETFNKDLVAELSKLDRVRLVRLLANGKVIACQYCYVFGRRCYWRLPARPADSSWDRFGLGRVGLIRMIEAMIAEGIDWIDAGAGRYAYKVQLGGRERKVRSILLVRSTPLAKLRCRLFLKLAAALHFAYYRVWYLRVAPRLPFRQGPLRQCWIKSRI